MSYVYAEERSKLFTDEGQRFFLKVRDAVKYLLKESGAVKAEELFSNEKFKIDNDYWKRQACLDRMVELGDIVEIPNTLTRSKRERIFVEAPID